MKDWRHKRITDLGLRLGGLVLCAISWLAIRTLVHAQMASLPASPGLRVFTFAAVGCICASIGSALVLIGNQVFADIEIGKRWGPIRTEKPIFEASATIASEADSLAAPSAQSPDEQAQFNVIAADPFALPGGRAAIAMFLAERAIGSAAYARNSAPLPPDTKKTG